MSVHLLQLLLHHLLLLPSSSLSAVIVASSSSLKKLMKLLKLLFNLTLCVLSLRLKSNHFTSIISINTHQHITSFRSKRNSDNPTYNRSRSRLLLIIYNNNNLKSIILNITNHNYVGLKKPIYCYLSLLLFF